MSADVDALLARVERLEREAACLRSVLQAVDRPGLVSLVLSMLAARDWYASPGDIYRLVDAARAAQAAFKKRRCVMGEFFSWLIGDNRWGLWCHSPGVRVLGRRPSSRFLRAAAVAGYDALVRLASRLDERTKEPEFILRYCGLGLVAPGYEWPPPATFAYRVRGVAPTTFVGRAEPARLYAIEFELTDVVEMGLAGPRIASYRVPPDRTPLPEGAFEAWQAACRAHQFGSYTGRLGDLSRAAIREAMATARAAYLDRQAGRFA